jgi:hypothetical protein
MRIIYNILQRNKKIDFIAVHFNDIFRLSKRLGHPEKCELHFMRKSLLH